jgi:lysophospholipase L1-like esterase
MAKLKAGERVRVAYFGGSITQAPGWRVGVHEWLAGRYPAAIDMIQAAIGGTGSNLGVFRVRRDVLAHDTDLVFVEFATNDCRTDPDLIARSMEGIVRQIRRARPLCDIAFVYTTASILTPELREGRLHMSAHVHEQVAEHYGIPSIHLGLEVARQEASGALVFMTQGEEKKRLEAAGKIVFSEDGCHPSPAGHRLYTTVVARALTQLEGVGERGPHPLPAPRVADHWEAARLVPLADVERSSAVRRLERTEWPGVGGPEFISELWRLDSAEATIRFQFRGIALGLYDVVGPDAGQIEVVLDDRPPEHVVRFDAYCSYHRLLNAIIADRLPEGIHTVRIRPGPPLTNKAAIMGKNYDSNPSRYEGNVWYGVALMIVGTSPEHG